MESVGISWRRLFPFVQSAGPGLFPDRSRRTARTSSALICGSPSTPVAKEPRPALRTNARGKAGGSAHAFQRGPLSRSIRCAGVSKRDAGAPTDSRQDEFPACATTESRDTSRHDGLCDSATLCIHRIHVSNVRGPQAFASDPTAAVNRVTLALHVPALNIGRGQEAIVCRGDRTATIANRGASDVHGPGATPIRGVDHAR